MKPLTWIALGTGTLVVGLGLYEAFKSTPAAASTPPGGGPVPPGQNPAPSPSGGQGAATTLSFLGGERYTVVVTPSGPLTSSPTAQTAATALGANFTPVGSLTATPSTVTLVVDVASPQTMSSDTFAAAVGAPAGSVVTATDSGPTPGAISSSGGGGAAPPGQTLGLVGQTQQPQGQVIGSQQQQVNIPNFGAKTISLESSANGTTVQANVGDTIKISQLVQMNDTPWTYSVVGGTSVTKGSTQTISGGKNTSTSTQVDLFNALAAGKVNIYASHTPGPTLFSLTVVVS